MIFDMTRQEFPRRIKLAAFERAQGKCEACTARLYPGKYRYDHRLLRFGPTEIQPGQPFNNACRLALEIGDLLEIIDRARLAGLILPGDIEIGRQKKREQLAKYMQTTPATISVERDVDDCG